MDFKLDRYTLNARLAPMLIVLMPVGLSIISLFPAKSSNLGIVFGAVTYCGMLVLLSNMGRDLGKKCEDVLFEEWGGSSTYRLLNPATSEMASLQLEKIHSCLSELTGILFSEDYSSEKKKEVIEAWTTYLRTNTRGNDNGQFRLVFSENINFGFRRNLFGLRYTGIFLACIALIVVIGDHTIITWGGDKAWHLDLLDLRPASKAAIFIIFWTIAVFFFVVKKN